MNTLIHDVTTLYLQHAHAARAQQQKAYMRHHFEHIGLTTPQRRKIDHAIIKKYHFTHEDEILVLVKELWNKEHREYQYCAVELLLKNHALWTPNLLQEIYHLAKSKAWWDSIDDIARNVVGVLLQKYPHLIKTMSEWIHDENMWIRRIAIIFQLRYKHTTNQEILFNHCIARAHEKEFFIRKAIGWALREYAKTNATAVLNFLALHDESLSSLSKKEARKHLE